MAKLYEVTKDERNKYMSLIQISNQNLAEVKEKRNNKLEKDLQIQQMIVINKDKYLKLLHYTSNARHVVCHEIGKMPRISVLILPDYSASLITSGSC